MPDEELGQSPKIGLTKEQKTGFVLLLVFAVLAVGLGVLQIRNSLYRPFALNNSVPPLVKDEINTADTLRYRDTDFDGLSDFDELYVYGTSPYLADTDSDGIPDGDEVKKGSDPNCAAGKTCLSVSTNMTGTDRPASLASSSLDLQAPSAPTNLLEVINDPAQLRKFFIDNGVPEANLNKISDADLLKGVQEVVGKANLTQANLNSLFNSTSTNQTTSTL